MSFTLPRAAARLLVVPVALSAFLVAAPSAHANETFETASGVATDTGTQRQVEAGQRAAKAAATRGERVIAKVRTRAGDPYRYGAAGPGAFDCSGLVQWTYRQVGKRLPRTSGAQAGATRRIAHPRRGDLVFFTSGGHVYHVGIYAGNHTIWHASRPGVPVRKERIWTGSVFYGRVR